MIRVNNSINHARDSAGGQRESRRCLLFIAAVSSLVFVASCIEHPRPIQNATSVRHDGSHSGKPPETKAECTADNTVYAEVVALEQIITFNRFGAFNPAGMVYALRRDVEDSSSGKRLSDISDAELKMAAGRVKLRDDKRPRPLVLRVNEGQCLQVKFWNLLSPLPTVHSNFARADFPAGGVAKHSVLVTGKNDPDRTDIVAVPRQEEPDYPTTRSASMHVNGLDYVPVEPQQCDDDDDTSGCDGDGVYMGSDGANVGNNPSSLVSPGKHTTYKWYARQEGGYFFYSAGALAGGEGDGGQLGLGLFGSINVEPQESVWYRSQVTYCDLQKANGASQCNAKGAPGTRGEKHAYEHLDYRKLAILEGKEIVHSDLNAVIYQPGTGPSEKPEICAKRSPGASCGMSFREFTTIFHDENKVFQAFAELADESNPLSAIADGMAVNYGSSGAGSAVLASLKKIGPAKDCPECKLEEFFLTSWANGDPAMIVKRDANGNAEKALYDDDPSNVHHAYLGDPVRFRNIHAGPKETHVFHLHAHQWLQDKNDPNANYLDSQTISPGSSYTYDIQYGGGGNRNLTPGDAIFHCHLYPHFAAGMWELWRNHDVFEDGKPAYFDDRKKLGDPMGRNLPDHEIANGTPNPAIVPIPNFPLAPMPSAEFRGYPFYIPATPGHRPPQPPLDMARDAQGKELNGGLPRHVIVAGAAKESHHPDLRPEKLLQGQGDPSENRAAAYIAKRTWKLNSDPNNLALAHQLEWAELNILPQCGTQSELIAMAFHAGWDKTAVEQLKQGKLPPGMPAWCKDEVRQVAAGLPAVDWGTVSATTWPNVSGTNPLWEGKGYDFGKSAASGAAADKSAKGYDPGTRFRVNGYAPAPGAPYADPCPPRYFDVKNPAYRHAVPVNQDNPRIYKAAYIQFDMTVNKYGWHDPQARMPVLEEDAEATLTGKRLAEPLFFRANSGDCIQFQATNLIPGVLNLDDFQVYTPTDTIGQHIHLVKFDVTSSDGSANGWNYEDGTFAPDEVRERIEASHAGKGHAHKSPEDWGGGRDLVVSLRPTTHGMFVEHGSIKGDKRKLGWCKDQGGSDHNPWCGAQATVQRWWADPVLNDEWKDRTMRAVFTHDHYGPSSHQQHGFYAALVVEPRDSVWTQLDAKPTEALDSGHVCPAAGVSSGLGGRALGGSAHGTPMTCRNDGGPTSYAANIGYPQAGDLHRDDQEVRREYNLAFADFAILYNADLRPVNPPSRQADLMLPDVVRDGLKPKPEGISTEDPGTRLLNYRNEPIPLRIAEEDKQGLEYHQKRASTGHVSEEGDMSNVFSSVLHHAGKNDQGCQLAPIGSCLPRFAGAAPTEHAQLRLRKLLANTPNEILDKGELRTLLTRAEQRRRAFLARLYADEPWRDHGGGDPSTPILAAYEGEPVKLQLIQGAQEEQHVFSMTGMKWLAEPESKNSGYMNGQQIGISEHFEFDVSPQVTNAPTDYWYGSPAVENMWDGMWGLVRAYAWKASGNQLTAVEQPWLKRLSTGDANEPPRLFGNPLANVCPKDAKFAPRKDFQVTAWLASELLAKVSDQARSFYNTRFGISDPNAVVLVSIPQELAHLTRSSAAELLDALQNQYRDGRPLEPLILRANAGDCVTVHLKNYLPARLDDGPDSPDSWSYNLMPPIVNGFNFNQVQMSSNIGLVPQLIAEDVAGSPSARVGIKDGRFDRVTQACQFRQDGRFVACDAAGSEAESNSRADYTWYLGDRKILSGGVAVQDSCTDSKPYCDEVFRDRTGGKEEITAIIRYQPIEFGAFSLRSFGDVIKHSSHGAIGAMVVEPRKSDCRIGKGELKTCGPADAKDLMQSQASADIVTPKESFRDFVLLIQDDLSLRQGGQPMPNHRMADDAEDTGQKGFNYRTEALWARNGVGTSGADFNVLNQVNYTNTLSSLASNAGCQGPCGDPSTPVFEAAKGQKVRFRVVHPGGHSRQHAFVLYGHNWEYQPWGFKSTVMQDVDTAVADQDPNRHVSSRVGAMGGLGPARHGNILTLAGGVFCNPGDYLYRVQENFQFHGGLWGIFRVKDDGTYTDNCHSD